MSKSNAQLVKEFTEEYTDKKCPAKPIMMSKEEVFFIIRMVMSELDEMASTVTTDKHSREEFMKLALENIDKSNDYKYDSDVSMISAQADAMVDAWYYMLNAAAKCGINLSKIFDIVHEANMAKKDPKTGKFIRRESDGKVLKPDGWKPPNIDGEIERQLEHGAWS